MLKLYLGKAEETEIKLPTSFGSSKSERVPGKKKIYFCFIDYAKVFHMYGSQQTVENSSKMGILTTLPASWDICMQVKKQQLELDMEQQIGSRSRKEYIMAVYCHPAYLTYIQSTSWEMLDWMKQKLDSRLPG